MSRTHAFLAMSLDGCIAGPNNELDWLPGHGEAEVEDTFTPFFAGVGAMLMGPTTFDVVRTFPGPWPYGSTPVLVASTRPLPEAPESVERVEGQIAALVEEAKRLAGDREVYVDGGVLVRSVLEAGLLDRLTLTVVPVVLGAGIPLFAEGTFRRLGLEDCREIGGGLVQLRYTLVQC